MQKNNSTAFQEILHLIPFVQTEFLFMEDEDKNVFRAVATFPELTPIQIQPPSNSQQKFLSGAIMFPREYLLFNFK